MGYRVIKFFTDLQDREHPYNVGDSFPRPGHEVSEERIKELAGSDNKRHTPLIEKTEEKPEIAPAQEKTKEEPEVVGKPKKVIRRTKAKK